MKEHPKKLGRKPEPQYLAKSFGITRNCCMARGAIHSLEKAYEIFSQQKDLYGFLMDFS